MTAQRGRTARPLLIALGGLAAALAGAALASRWLDAVEVHGESMAPTLLPGDRLLVESISYALRSPRVDEIVLAPDPRAQERELVKRIVAIGDDGTVVVRGDGAAQSTDSRVFGPLPATTVRWRVLVRYAPLDRLGRP